MGSKRAIVLGSNLGSKRGTANASLNPNASAINANASVNVHASKKLRGANNRLKVKQGLVVASATA